VSYYLREASDVPRVVALFRLNYERPWTAGRALDALRSG